MKVLVEMTRGGKILLEVDGRVYTDSDGAGRKWTEVEIMSIKWPGGGIVADKNIKDMTQVEEAFLEAEESNSEAIEVDAYERAHNL
jgi:butyrate kinase